MKYIYPINVNGKLYYQVNFFYKSKKIYLGRYSSIADAQITINEATDIVETMCSIKQAKYTLLSFNKVVILINLRDNGTYFKNPIYLYEDYFGYYISSDIELLFDLIHLFFFATYKIYKRGNLFYTQHTFTQSSILNRLGIVPSSRINIDYKFKNNNPFDFRSDNLEVLKRYYGVSAIEKGEKTLYQARISKPNTIIIGIFESEIKAAIAYNKAVDYLKSVGMQYKLNSNVIFYITKKEYDIIYDEIELPYKLTNKVPQNAKKFRGVVIHKSGFKACIGYKGKSVYLGLFSTEIRAAQAYNLASYILKGHKGYRNPVSPIFNFSDQAKIIDALKRSGWRPN
ncbi:hypothetical protein AN640_07890 [Candidatus Epulonipiscium fishelsonii]|uniref:Uncharacterized protein n=1 Tax=Candidatus Epulonipiscium fishelsonii TaxID=77094 RepID=A0ACC8XEL1_9FIRM|nr:hypothetical protein AN640_07890 [Epulopiscium sp. SCG-D08WGA-EpuloA1]OON90696.1 MAG: hypothetical protein ATN32_03415 [Epulopiscium sp. AS2M-Bin002]